MELAIRRAVPNKSFTSLGFISAKSASRRSNFLIPEGMAPNEIEERGSLDIFSYPFQPASNTSFIATRMPD
jgi:hypothetical protein